VGCTAHGEERSSFMIGQEFIYLSVSLGRRSTGFIESLQNNGMEIPHTYRGFNFMCFLLFSK